MVLLVLPSSPWPSSPTSRPVWRLATLGRPTAGFATNRCAAQTERRPRHGGRGRRDRLRKMTQRSGTFPGGWAGLTGVSVDREPAKTASRAPQGGSRHVMQGVSCRCGVDHHLVETTLACAVRNWCFRTNAVATAVPRTCTGWQTDTPILKHCARRRQAVGLLGESGTGPRGWGRR